MAEVVNRFNILCKELSSIAYLGDDGVKQPIGNILDGFNSLDQDCIWSDNAEQKVLLVINQCCYIIPINEESLVANALKFFTTLLTKQNVIVEGRTLDVLVTWCIECLKTLGNDSIHCLALGVIQKLIITSRCQVKDYGSRVVNVCQELMCKQSSNDSREVYFNCLKCLECLVFVEDSEPLPDTLLLGCLDILLGTLYDQTSFVNVQWQYKCYLTALSGIANICAFWTNPVQERLPDILGAVKGYMLFGLPGQDYVVEKVLPSFVALPDQLKPSQPIKKLKGKYDRSSKKKSVTPMSEVQREEDGEVPDASIENSFMIEHLTLTTTSDSDVSDSEGELVGRLKSLRTKIRLSALSLLGSIIEKGDPKVLTRYLPTLLPDGSQVLHSRSLITCLLKDPSSKCRSEALIVLSGLLTKFKPCLIMADGASRSSFTAFSNNIGNTLTELHRALVLVLLAETSRTVITLILKTMSNLVRCTPYHKLNPGSLSHMSKRVRTFLKNDDVNVKISALAVFGCIASIDVKTEESIAIIQGNESDRNNYNNKPWLLAVSLDFLFTGSCNLALAVECLQVVGALVRNYFHDVVVSHPKETLHILNWGINKKDYPIRLYSAKLLETVVDTVQANLHTEDELRRPRLTLAKEIWSEIIPGALTTLMQSQDRPALRSAGCEAICRLSFPGEESLQGIIYDELPRSHQILVITQLFDRAVDPDQQVRSSAIRALAVLVQFPNLREDPLFYMDVVDLFFKTSRDEHQGIRIQAAWLYGNLTDAALMNSENGSSELDDSTLVRLFEAGISLAKDIPKVRPNGVRGLGNLLRIVSCNCVQQHREKLEAGLDIIVKTAMSASLMKARWNSCYAIGNAAKNSAVSQLVRLKAFPTLCDLLQRCKNFKVRIAAGQALAAFPERISYGEAYIAAWGAALNAFENVENMTDFNEYLHRDQLVETLCVDLCHLLSLITVNDLTSVDQMLHHRMSNVKAYLQRCRLSMVPEKTSVIFNATARLTELSDSKNLESEHKSILSSFLNMLETDATESNFY